MPTRSQRLDTLISLMFSTGRIIHERTKPEEKFDPSSVLRLQALRFIAERPQTTMRDIADVFCITPPSATSLIAGLVRSGQIKRIPDRRDRRIVLLCMTAIGQRMLKSGTERIHASLRSVFALLSEPEQGNLIHILRKLSHSTVQTVKK